MNDAGGILGQEVAVRSVNDFCDPEQALAAARILVEAEVAVVIGHPCSSAAIPASTVYEDADILFISPAASHPELTEQSFDLVFRVVGRDDRQTRMAAERLARYSGDRAIAILHDDQTFGRGLAEQTKRRLASRGIDVRMFAAIEPGQVDYLDVVQEMRAGGIDILYFGGYAAEAGLIARHARDLNYDLQIISGDNLNTQYFWQVAGEAAEGTLFTSFPDARDLPAAAEFVRTFRARYLESESIAVFTYAAAQVWQQAVQHASSPDAEAVAKALRTNTFDTVLGRIGFDEKGDVTGYGTYAWYVWQKGTYLPADADIVRPDG